MEVTRRDLVLVGTSVATTGVIGAAVARWWSAPPAAASMAGMDGRRIPPDRYGHGASPPADLGPLSLDRATRPPLRDGLGSGSPVRRLVMEVVNQSVGVSADQTFDAWTFGGTVPGPIIRATEGDRIEITLRNRTDQPHNLHFHGRHEIEADGWEPVPAGGESVYRFTAGPFGVHPYHCDFTPSADHIANGLFGLLIVDPPRPRPAAHELVLVLCGFDTDRDGTSDLFGWNGAAGFYAKYPIKVPVGQLVRVYLANLVTDIPAASFHLHAETFDVFRSGTRLTADERTDVINLGPAERAILEFRLPNRGRYMFHPHQRRLAERGAMGWFSAV